MCPLPLDLETLGRHKTKSGHVIFATPKNPPIIVTFTIWLTMRWTKATQTNENSILVELLEVSGIITVEVNITQEHCLCWHGRHLEQEVSIYFD